MPPRALALNCSLKASGPSSTDRLLRETLDALARHGVEVGEPVRVAALNVLPGVSANEGPPDEWPGLRRRILDADILVIGTPIWLGHPSSIAQRVLERLDAFLGETDEEGRLVTFGRVAIVAVVGNEDGAHHVIADLFQALSDVGFTIPAGGSTYWVGQAMGRIDYLDLDGPYAKTAETTATAAANAAHLARLLATDGYPRA